jgi:hypothetical protein
MCGSRIRDGRAFRLNSSCALRMPRLAIARFSAWISGCHRRPIAIGQGEPRCSQRCCRVSSSPHPPGADMEVNMRRNHAILGMLLFGLVPCGPAQAAPRQPACVELMSACEQAGFVRGDAKGGDGLFVDCVVPILRGTPQRRRASKPLPQIDPGLVANCRAQNPNFGQRAAPASKAGEPPVQASPRPATPEGTPTRQPATPLPPQAAEPPVQADPPSTATTPRVSPVPQINNNEEE